MYNTEFICNERDTESIYYNTTVLCAYGHLFKCQMSGSPYAYVQIYGSLLPLISHVYSENFLQVKSLITLHG